MNFNANLEHLSVQDLHTFLYTPINLFGYKFLVNLVSFLWMYNGLRYATREEPDTLKPYHFIVIGGGTSGSIMAARLSENPLYRVLLLESGGIESQLTDVPYISQLWRDSRLDWKIKSNPQENACLAYEDARCILSQGKGLGGSSTISGMTYLRGNPEDFDRWGDVFRSLSWSWLDVYPYFLKSQDSIIVDLDTTNSHHHSGGPLPVEYQRYDPPFVHEFLESIKLRGYKVGDYNGGNQMRFNRVQSFKSKGRRVSTKKAFLDPAKDRKNLDIITFGHVTRILFDTQQRAVGVEYLKDNQIYRSLAVNEVILSAGAIRSPQILQLSGIGHPDLLNATSIQMIANLTGVGSNLHDHVYSMLHFSVNTSDTMKPSRVNLPANYAAFTLEGKGPLTSMGEVGHGFVQSKHIGNRSRAADLKITYYALSPMSFTDDTFWNRVLGFKRTTWNRYFKPYYTEETTTISIGLMKPKSRGKVYITTDNPMDDPLVDPQYLSHLNDTLAMMEGIKTATQIGMSHSFTSHAPILNPNHFPGCESFELWSEDYVKCYMKHYTVKGDNFVGTCRMGHVDDPDAVVDHKLRVMGGVKGLRVVDASVIPEIPSGDIMATVVMIAERAADMIKADHGYP